MKYKRQKLMISTLIFLVGLWINIYFSTNLHFLLSKQMKVLSLISIKECINSMATSEAHLSLFLCLQGFILLSAIYYYVANHKPYQSELVEITPEIWTPEIAGQKQFGSAKWLTDKEKDSVFKSFILDSKSSSFKPFLAKTKKELKRINERVIADEKSKDGKDEKSKVEESKEYEITIKNEKLYNTSKNKVKEQGYQKKYQLPKIESGGIVIGSIKTNKTEKIYYIDDDTHTLCIGATRSGKTRNVLLQSIGAIGLAEESMILSDPKGELFTYTYPFLKNMDYEIICIDFKNPLKSNRYNFLQPVIDAVEKDNIP
ncbi:MAG: type IV secretory system conjugative DNA transfer family protein, partial [Bacillota bacterium]|nr:type IV secretory system conjugative DNA transfer family protein [Bacillota bacterium]